MATAAPPPISSQHETSKLSPRMRAVMGVVGVLLVLAMFMTLCCLNRRRSENTTRLNNDAYQLRRTLPQYRPTKPMRKVMTSQELDAFLPEQWYIAWQEIQNTSKSRIASDANSPAMKEIEVKESRISWPSMPAASVVQDGTSRKSSWDEEASVFSRQIHARESSAGRCCAICLEAYDEHASIRVLKCNHVFHATCSKAWLTQQSCCCPVCRMDCLDLVQTLEPSRPDPAYLMAVAPDESAATNILVTRFGVRLKQRIDPQEGTTAHSQSS